MKIEFLKIDGEGYHLVVNITINSIPARMILDTGASRTVLHSGSVDKYKASPLPFCNGLKSIGIEGVETLHREVVLDLMELDDIKMKNAVIATLDMTHVNNAYRVRDLPPVDGLLGGDVLMDTKAVIDYFVGDVSFL